MTVKTWCLLVALFGGAVTVFALFVSGVSKFTAAALALTVVSVGVYLMVKNNPRDIPPL